MAAIILYRGNDEIHIPEPVQQIAFETYSKPIIFETGNDVGEFITKIKGKIIRSADRVFYWTDESKTTARYVFENIAFPEKSFINNHATYFDDRETWAANELHAAAPTIFHITTSKDPNFDSLVAKLEDEGRLIVNPIKKEKGWKPKETKKVPAANEAIKKTMTTPPKDQNVQQQVKEDVEGITGLKEEPAEEQELPTSGMS